MDTFLEYLVKRKSTGRDFAVKLGIVLLTLLCMSLVFTLFMSVELLRSFGLLAVVAVVYGAYIWLRNLDLEYEYIFTNGDLDIDAIKGRKVRKRLTSVSCRGIELMASSEDSVHKNEFENESITKKIDAVYDRAAGGIYCVIFTDKGERKLLSFQPPQKLVESMKTYNPRCIFPMKAE